MAILTRERLNNPNELRKLGASLQVQARLTRRNPQYYRDYLAGKDEEEQLLLRSNLDAFIEAFEEALHLEYPLDAAVVDDARYLRGYFED